MTHDEQQIRDVITRQAAAVGDKDSKAMTDGYAHSALIFNLAPPLRQPGNAQEPESAAAWLATFKGPMSMKVRDLEITQDGDVAFATSLKCLSATPKGSTESFTLWYRATHALRRIDGQWLITHEHESVPFEMDGSFAASINLEP